MPRMSGRGRATCARGALVLATSALIAAPARANPQADARLVFSRDSASSSCVDEPALREAVGERLGYDPFTNDSSVQLHVHVFRERGRYRGTLERQLAAEARSTASHYEDRSSDCRELGPALALALAVAIDPHVLLRPAPPPATAPERAAPQPEPAPPPPVTPSKTEPVPVQPAPRVAPAARTHRPQFVGGLGPSVSVAALPSPAFGVRALAGLRVGAFELDAEGRLDLPVHGEGDGFQASLATVSLAPCLRHRFLIGCAQASIGALRGTGLGFDRTREASTFYASAGARAGVEWAPHPNLSLRFMLEAAVPLRPTRLEGGGQLLWSTPALSFAATPMLLVRFP